MTEVRKSVNKQSSDEINKEKDESDESMHDNGKTPSVNTQSTQQTKLSQSTDQPLTSASDRTTTECGNYRVNGRKYNTQSTQQTKLLQSTDQQLISASDRTTTECSNYRVNGSLEKCNTQSTQQTKLPQSIDQPFISASDYIPTEYSAYLKMKNDAMRSSSESLDNASHVAVVNHSLYNSSTCRGYIRGEMRLLQNVDHKRSNNLFSVLDIDRGYSSSGVEGWV